ncbi:MAG: serine hydrolase [bacterium]
MKQFGMRTLLYLLFVVLFSSCKREANQAANVIGPRPDYAQVVQELERIVNYEMEDKGLPALSIALVDDQETVWARGFGMADPDHQTPATAQTVYRVGSVSKLFTDIGVMQLVEKGELDLEAPVTEYLPEFKPQNSFDKTITLRQLMSHRAGLVREPPVGHYFDPAEPTLAAMVASLNQTALVYEPETRIKYSNAGIGTVGFVLERKKGAPFADYLQKAVLEPLGLKNSAFTPTRAIRSNLAKAYMWTYDKRRFVAPSFQLGMAPAGSMYAPVTDLARFLSVLFNGGKSSQHQLLKPETLAQMWQPQFADSGAQSGFGLGFALSEFHGYRRIGHGGAIYGFASELAALPEAKVGAIVITTLDCANHVVTRIADHALALMLAQRNHQPLPAFGVPDSIRPAIARRWAGRYATDENRFELIERDGKLYLALNEFLFRLKALGDTLIVDDRLAYGARIIPEGNKLRFGEELFSRQAAHSASAIPRWWEGLLGEYGWDHNTLFVLEREGQLHALIEWFFNYPLQEVSPDTFLFPNYGLYHGERLIFARDSIGQALQVEAASVLFKRRAVGLAAGETFRIQALKPAAELRQIAAASQPPQERGEFLASDLVELHSLDPSLRYDIRYATTNNFMNTVFYDEQKAFLQRPAAEALVRVHRKLKQQGLGLLIHDAYRPWYVTKMFWEATPADKKIFVADPAQGSRHNRGCAIDLTLFDLKSGQAIDMVSGYDEFSDRANPDYPGGTSLQRWHRDLLRRAMENEGFRVYEWEWWHFDFKDWRRYPISNLTFEQISSQASD